MLLRVHPSNFRITGFTERPSLAELVALGERFHLPVYEDLGSGCIADLSTSGIAEPVARASCDAGASIITFSGDKLLGGPQAGIIAGKKEFVERIRSNPLFRALRVDKLTIAALEATLQSYQRGALDEIPALRMIRLSQKEIAERAQNFCEKFRPALPADVKLEFLPGFSVIGGGSTPDQQLPTSLIAISTPRHSAAQLEDRLRKPRTSNPTGATSPTATPSNRPHRRRPSNPRPPHSGPQRRNRNRLRASSRPRLNKSPKIKRHVIPSVARDLLSSAYRRVSVPPELSRRGFEI